MKVFLSQMRARAPSTSTQRDMADTAMASRPNRRPARQISSPAENGVEDGAVRTGATPQCSGTFLLTSRKCVIFPTLLPCSRHRSKMVVLLNAFPLRDLRPRFSLQFRSRYTVPLQRLCVPFVCGHQSLNEFLRLLRPIDYPRLCTAQIGLDAGR